MDEDIYYGSSNGGLNVFYVMNTEYGEYSCERDCFCSHSVYINDVLLLKHGFSSDFIDSIVTYKLEFGLPTCKVVYVYRRTWSKPF